MEKKGSIYLSINKVLLRQRERGETEAGKRKLETRVWRVF
jgi:hypothetical protein